MLLALTTFQIALMLASFAGMIVFASLALWLWQRERQAPPPARPAQPARLDVAPAPSQPPRPAPEVHEPTEFVALPGQREADSPQLARDESADEQPERTEFVAAPLGHHGEDEDRTAFVTPFGMDAAPAPARQEDRTAFVAPPEPDEDHTAFIPAPDFDSLSYAPPAPSFAAPSHAPPPPSFATPSHAPPAAAPSPPSFASPSPAPPSFATPSHAPSRAAPAPPTGLHGQLAEHFELAVADLAALDRADGPTTSLDGHLEVLASAPAEDLLASLRPTLAAPDPSGARRSAAWLALLHHKSWPATRALPELLDSLDDEPRQAGLWELASWDDARAPGLAAAGLAHSQASPARWLEWLELFAKRGWDPGDAAFERALNSSEPAEVIVGLRLAGARPPEQLRPKLSALLFAGDPSARLQAIEAGLCFSDPRAWMLGRQLARGPTSRHAIELFCMLGSASEVDELSRTASTPELLWGLGLSGRPSALEPCALALADPELKAAAGEALAIVSGRGFESSAAAQTWLTGQVAPRLIGGATRSPEALAHALAGSSPLRLRHAIARELRIRGSGRVLLTPELRPRAWRRQLAALHNLDLDLTRDFPWQG